MIQNTLASIIRLNGTTLHAGVSVTCEISPADINTGLIFRRLDALPEVAEVRVSPENIVVAPLCSRIANEGGTSISTLEHLMAAFRALEISNAIVTLDGPELPILDGSSLPWVRAIEEAGVQTQDAPAPTLKVLRSIKVGDEERFAALHPMADGQELPTFSAEIDFELPSIGQQKFAHHLSADNFKQDLASARSFVMASHLPELQTKGLVRGGTLSNAVVFDAHGVQNPEGLRFPDEPIRHKLLDAVGDMYLSGARIQGNYHGSRAGHALHATLLKTLFADESAWTWTEDYMDSKVVAFPSSGR